MKPVRQAMIVVGALCVVGTSAAARPEYAAKENKACGYCHVNEAGGGPRNPRGLYYAAHNHSFEGYDEAQVMGGGAPKKTGPPAFAEAWKIQVPNASRRIAVADVVGDKRARLLVLGEAGRVVVVEDRLEGQELSVLALCDGESYMLLPPARDHKRAFDGDAGPNTGGMGACAPVPLPAAVLEAVQERIIAPAVSGMAREGFPYRGVLYAGLMLTREGPAVLEFNCRFGDPETQAIMPLLDEDLGELLAAAARGELPRRAVRVHNRYAVCVVVASGGYPGPYRRGVPIDGLARAAEVPGVVVFEAGTAQDEAGRILTAGGRVLGVTGCGHSLSEARERAYRACARISFEGMHYRRDIGTGVA